jgi:hypothetical protein
MGHRDGITSILPTVSESKGGPRMKEQVTELNLRREMMAELGRSKGNVRNLIKALPRNVESSTSERVKEILDEIEIFEKDMELSNTGHKFTMFNENPSVNNDTIKDIEKLDRDILDRLRILTKASSILYTKTIDKESREIPHEVVKMKSYLSEVRQKFSDRNRMIKGV